MIGRTMGPYKVVAKLGEGGMGEVYRARDTQLDRDVALKILPESVANDPDRLMRFEREAKTLASLNHPNIAQIFGVQESSGPEVQESGITRALVMELVEGDDLSVRLAQGAMPLDDALPIARQIAEALEAAHEAGIIHRDLKPANIKVKADGTVKVLDFGLAKALSPEHSAPSTAPGAPSTEHSALTVTSPALTALGMILGTAAYMSPEQARGRPVDRRADIWAFGVVLYEMLTGRRLFAGESVSDTIASVLRADIDLSALPASTPASVRRLVTRCLERDPKRRLQHIGEARITLADPADQSQQYQEPPSLWRRGAPWLAATVTLVLGAIAGALFGAPEPEPPAQVWMELAVPDAARVGGPAISWDGAVVAWASTAGLRVRRVDGTPVRTFDGTSDATYAAWLPDGSAIAYRDPVAGAIKLVSLADGAVRTLAATQPGVLAPIYVSARGDIAFNEGFTGVKVVPASGGSARTVIVADNNPTVLPLGFIAATGELLYQDRTARSVRAISPDGSGDREVVGLTAFIFGASDRRQDLRLEVFIPAGFVAFGSDGSTLIQRLDATSLAPVGEPVVLASTEVRVAASADGRVIAWQGQLALFPLRRLFWIGSNGETTDVGAPQPYFGIALAPDGQRAAVVIVERDAGKIVSHVSLLDFARPDLRRRLASMPDRYLRQLQWTSNNTALLAISQSVGGDEGNVIRIATTAATPPEQLRGDVANFLRAAFTADGRQAVVSHLSLLDVTTELRVVDIHSDDAGRLYLPSVTNARTLRLSPDERWLAFESSEEGGSRALYVDRFPEPAGPTPIAADTNSFSWSEDSRRLFYIKGGQLMEVSIVAEGGLAVGEPRTIANLPEGTTSCQPAPNRRFLCLADLPNEATQVINVVINKFSGSGSR